MRTRPADASAIAARNPAIPLPTMTKSAVNPDGRIAPDAAHRGRDAVARLHRDDRGRPARPGRRTARRAASARTPLRRLESARVAAARAAARARPERRRADSGARRRTLQAAPDG